MTVDELERDEEQIEPTSRWQRLATGSTTWIILILAGMIVVFSLMEPSSFATVNNARNVGTNAAILLVVAVGMTFVIITAGIDLSVGSVLVFSGVVSAKAMNGMDGDGWDVILVGLVVALGCGLGWGILNGLLITKARVPPLIVTLGTLGMALGLALIITDGVDVREVPPKLVTSIGVGRVFDQIPWLVVIAAAVAIVFGVVLASTRFGRHTYAIGSNDEAARRAGINVDRHLIAVYAIAGGLAGLAGFMSLARFATTTIGGHATDNLSAIA
jgi:ribose transport system permease protein